VADLHFIFLVAAIGLRLITQLSRRLNDPHLQKLGYLYLLKLLALLVLLYVAWVPMLDPGSTDFGYDPQRYYHYSKILVDSGFDITEVLSIENLNYVGILYYYAVVMAVFGQNPVSPMLINAFVTLLAVLCLVRLGYMIKRERSNQDWWLGLAILLPEVFWFDALTARETLSMSLITISSSFIAGYLIRRSDDHIKSKNVILVVVPSLLLLAIVRSSALLAPITTMVLLFLSLRQAKQNRALALGVLFFAVIVVLLEPVVSTILGSSNVGYAWIFGQLTGVDKDGVELEGLGTFAKLLVPSNPFQAVLFVPVRLLLYLLAPLGVASFQLGGLLQGNWSSWQYLMMLLSALLNLLLFPLAVASLLHSLRSKNRSQLALNIPLWVTLGMIAGVT